MVDKVSAPAFSMGSSRTNIKHSSVPGPGTYEPNSIKTQNSSSNKISTQKRFNQYKTDVPGPGTYSSVFNDHIPTVSLLSKQKQQKAQPIPGPGAYDPDFHKLLKSQNGFKLGNSSKLDDMTKRWKDLPGPGQYDNGKSTLADLNSATKIGNDKRSDLGGNKWTPGPGQYQQKTMNGNIARDPKFTFGKQKRSLSLSQLGPGPAQYNIKDIISESVEKKKGFSLKFRTNTESHNDSIKLPGPGAYQNKSISLIKKGNPSFSLGKSQKLKLENEREFLSKPSPGSYSYNSSSFETKHGIKFDTQKRKGLETLSVVPGPGSYNLTIAREARQYSIPKSSPKGFGEDNKIPGPGSYQPKMMFNSQYENIGMNKDQRKPLHDQKLVPGPGQYNYQQKKTGGFTIGHEKRQQNKKKESPGPGMYNLPSTISNLPKYADVHR